MGECEGDLIYARCQRSDVRDDERSDEFRVEELETNP